MSYILTCHNNQTQQGYDMSMLAGSIRHSTHLRSQPGKLTFTLRKPPEESAEGGFLAGGEAMLSNGSMAKLEKDGRVVFLGYIFSMGTNSSGQYQITAYDQMRYLKNCDTKYIPAMTASDVFSKICADEGIAHTVDYPSFTVTPAYYHTDKSLYAMMEHHIMWANNQETMQYFIKDVAGLLTFTELGRHKTDAVIGDKSLLSNYSYEVSIDRDTYNVVKLYRENEKTGKIDVWIEMSGENQAKWGKLQLLEKADESANEAQIRELASRLLRLKNRETKTMSLNLIAAGSEVGLDAQDEVIDASLLVAGSGFKLCLSELGIEEEMWIENATHTYLRDVHLANLEVFLP